MSHLLAPQMVVEILAILEETVSQETETETEMVVAVVATVVVRHLLDRLAVTQ